jgi:hypothetical protein
MATLLCFKVTTVRRTYKTSNERGIACESKREFRTCGFMIFDGPWVLNHRDVSTTAIYARLDLNPVRQALERNAAKMLEAATLQTIPSISPEERSNSI